MMQTAVWLFAAQRGGSPVVPTAMRRFLEAQRRRWQREQQPAARRHGVSRAARWISRAACRCGRQMLLQCEYQYKYAYGREHLFRTSNKRRTSTVRQGTVWIFRACGTVLVLVQCGDCSCSVAAVSDFPRLREQSLCRGP